MPDLKASNPYPEDQSLLREAWNEGYRAGQKGVPLPDPGESLHDDAETELAWMEGYRFAHEQSTED